VVSLAGLVYAAFIVVVIGASLLVPVAVFRSAMRRHRASWEVTRRLALPSGAYRSVVAKVELGRGVPVVVAIASLSALYLVATGALALGVDLVGSASLSAALDVEAAGLGVVVAWVGARIVRRSPGIAGAARVAAAWEVVLGFALVLRGGAAPLFGVALAAHAFVLLAAAAAHDRGSVSA